MNSSSRSLAGELLLEPNVTAMTCDSQGAERRRSRVEDTAPMGQFRGAPLLPVALNQTRQPHPGKAPKLTPAFPTSR